jgi:hypothetical protein
MEAPNFRAEFAISSPSGLQFVACKKRGPPCQRHRSCLLRHAHARPQPPTVPHHLFAAAAINRRRLHGRAGRSSGWRSSTGLPHRPSAAEASATASAPRPLSPHRPTRCGTTTAPPASTACRPAPPAPAVAAASTLTSCPASRRPPPRPCPQRTSSSATARSAPSASPSRCSSRSRPHRAAQAHPR